MFSVEKSITLLLMSSLFLFSTNSCARQVAGDAAEGLARQGAKAIARQGAKAIARQGTSKLAQQGSDLAVTNVTANVVDDQIKFIMKIRRRQQAGQIIASCDRGIERNNAFELSYQELLSLQGSVNEICNEIYSQLQSQ